MKRQPTSGQPVALVTGASKGLGRAIAVGFGRQHYRVLVNYRSDAAEAERTVQSINAAGGTALAHQADVRDAKNVAAMIATTMGQWQRLDVLVCNAAVTHDALVLRLREEAWNDVLATNLTGVFHCLQKAGAVMCAQRAGAIILIGSLAGLQGDAGQAPYAAAKAGLLGLMRSAAREFGPDGLRVNLVLPGWHATALTGFQQDPSAPPFAATLGHGTTIDAVAAFVVGLAAMPDVSGQVFTLDSRIAAS